MFRRAEVIQKDVDASANGRPATVICNFEISDFDVLDVIEADYIFDLTTTVDFGFRSVSIAVDD